MEGVVLFGIEEWGGVVGGGWVGESTYIYSRAFFSVFQLLSLFFLFSLTGVRRGLDLVTLDLGNNFDFRRWGLGA